MSRIWSMMDVGKRSMMNSQTSLQTTAHNIANKNTEGFSRQRVETKTNVPVGQGKLRIGMGARPGEVTRVNNPYIEKQIETEGNKLGLMEGRASMLGRVEQVYNEQVNKGLNQFMSEFFNSLRELANNPESLATRTMVKESAYYLAKDFQRMDRQLNEIQEDADFRIAATVEEINQITREIANLNEKVTSVEIQGVTANDERDRRDLLVKKLSKMINIRYGESEDGQLSITAGNSAVLVSGFSNRDLFTSATKEKDGKPEAGFDVFYRATKDGTPVKITNQINAGEIGGLLQVRDVVVAGLRDKVDQLAYTLSREVNAAHTQGFDRYNRQGVSFFNPLGDVKGAAENLMVNKTIMDDVGRIAAGGQPGAPGDNRIANVMSSVQYKKMLSEDSFTVDDFYNSMVGQIGIETQRANSALETQVDTVKQLENIRESISGVSLDEEATKMIEFQKTFDASARLITTADEMMDTVLNLKRL